MSYINGLELFPHIMATQAINADSAGTTALDFINGASLADHIPHEVIFEWSDGTFDACSVDVLVNGSVIAAGVSLVGLLNSNRLSVDLKGQLVDNSGVIEIDVVVPNTGASAFIPKVIGISV